MVGELVEYSREDGEVPFKNPQSKSEKVINIRAILNDIESLLDETLGHISPEAVVNHDASAVGDLLEVITGLVSKCRTTKSSDNEEKLGFEEHHSPELPRRSGVNTGRIYSTSVVSSDFPIHTVGFNGKPFNEAYILHEDFAHLSPPMTPRDPVVGEIAGDPSPTSITDSGVETAAIKPRMCSSPRIMEAWEEEAEHENTLTSVADTLERSHGVMSILSGCVKEAKAQAQIVHDRVLATYSNASKIVSPELPLELADLRQSLVQLNVVVETTLDKVDRLSSKLRLPPPQVATPQRRHSLDSPKTTIKEEFRRLNEECKYLLDAKTKLMEESLRLCVRQLWFLAKPQPPPRISVDLTRHSLP
ncbi:unnamed protein product [Mesocestoides corti]|uniref:DUF5745 domain-containing protein n=1 Tax=Mesocestoides corti TaxID=53468 RepID=A0A0R3ULZ8_MESCO|nr:unnamed protein product [Mesocestoides corti]